MDNIISFTITEQLTAKYNANHAKLNIGVVLGSNYNFDPHQDHQLSDNAGIIPTKLLLWMSDLLKDGDDTMTETP
uniref:Uncharacterized protein n=1 Tax=Romanomermis culicivorax TaxID=13658 RepID=A0A915KQ51_ROMCU